MYPEFSQSQDPVELIDPTDQFRPLTDSRPRMPEPLPVKLVTVDHAWLISPAGLETQLDEFYVALLGFQRATPDDTIVYHAENFDLCFNVVEPPIERDHLRPLGIEILSLAQAETKLIDREIPYTRQESLNPGQEALALKDPAGNWLELTEVRIL
jgi:hypothetical protein